MPRVLVDTSALYALHARDDVHHTAAVAAMQSLRRERAEPLLTNMIVAESHALLLARAGHAVARRWLLQHTWPVERVTEGDEAGAQDIIRTYADKTFSYTDATSFAVMERLGIRQVFAFDRHFQQYGFEVLGWTGP